jgi:flagellar biosynthesis GTPase FlhF
MKKKLKKVDFDKLDKALQELYKKVEGKDTHDFELDVEDDDDDEAPDALKKALKAERDAVAKAKADIKAMKDELSELKKSKTAEADDEAKKKGDIEALEKSWKQKLADREKELGDLLSQRETSLREILVEGEAGKLAAALSKSPSLLLPHIKARLAAEFTDGKAVTRVLDKDGKPSAATIDDLRKEILANKDYAPILVGSNGSGGGSGGPGAGGGSFNIKDYKNEDGSVNWGKVHQGSKDNPDLVKQVSEAVNPTPQPSGF